MGKNSGFGTTTKDARAVIEEIARRKGIFTDSYRLEAEEEAKAGRGDKLQNIEGYEELRRDLVKSLGM